MLELPKTTGSLFRGSWPPFPFGRPGPSSMPDSKLKNHFEMAYHVRPACPTLNKRKNKQQENNCRILQTQTAWSIFGECDGVLVYSLSVS